MLQDEYQRLRKHSNQELEYKANIDFFGGSDQNNLTGLTLSIFLKLNRPDIKLDIVLDLGVNIKTKLGNNKQHSNIAMYANLPSIVFNA